eukprot:429324-Prymnesium_polylepis.1
MCSWAVTPNGGSKLCTGRNAQNAFFLRARCARSGTQTHMPTTPRVRRVCLTGLSMVITCGVRCVHPACAMCTPSNP